MPPIEQHPGAQDADRVGRAVRDDINHRRDRRFGLGTVRRPNSFDDSGRRKPAGEGQSLPLSNPVEHGDVRLRQEGTALVESLDRREPHGRVCGSP
jgi:hypothetical protein